MQACVSPPGSDQVLEEAKLCFPASKGQDEGARPGGRGDQGALTRTGEQVIELIAALFLAHFVPKLASIGKPAPSLREPLSYGCSLDIVQWLRAMEGWTEVISYNSSTACLETTSLGHLCGSVQLWAWVCAINLWLVWACPSKISTPVLIWFHCLDGLV